MTPGGSSTVHIYTQTVHRTTQNKQYIEQNNNLGECGPCPFLASYTLAFALQLSKKHGKFRQQAYLKLNSNFAICFLTVQPFENMEEICGEQSGTGTEIFVLSTPAFPCQNGNHPPDLIYSDTSTNEDNSFRNHIR